VALLRARGTLVAGAVALLSLVLTGCEGASEMGKIELDLYPVDVECDATSLECRDARGDVAVPAHYDTWMFASTETSSFEDGLFMTFELPTERGVAYVELDLPRHSDAETAGTFSYRELRGPERVFESTSARGRIELASDMQGATCDCGDGRLELELVDPGEDGALGTDDDAVRRLSRARFGWGERFCIEPRTLIEPEGERPAIAVVDRCPRTGPLPTPAPPADAGTTEWRTDPTDDDASCSSSSSSDSGCGSDSSSSSDSGCDCEGDSSSSGSGCEGDSSSSSGSGCDGDSSSGSGCDGDATPGTAASRDGATPFVASVCRAPRAPRRARRSRVEALIGRAQMPLFVGLVILYQRRKHRPNAARRL